MFVQKEIAVTVNSHVFHLKQVKHMTKLSIVILLASVQIFNEQLQVEIMIS